MERTHYPDAESRYRWLAPLLDTYHLTDKVIREDLALQEKKSPCGPGCCKCCSYEIIPMTEIEARGISWFVVENLKGRIRDKIIEELERYKPGQEKCPFLVDTRCGIYAVRPLACRTYYVLGEPCKTSWIIDDSQPNEIYRPPVEKMKEAVRPLLGAYGIHDPEKQSRAFHGAYLQKIAKPLNDLDWKAFLLNNIAIYDMTPV